MSVKRIEDVINEVLKGESQKNALDFIAYLNANEYVYKSRYQNIEMRRKIVGNEE